jgi:hypothetical protein
VWSPVWREFCQTREKRKTLRSAHAQVVVGRGREKCKTFWYNCVLTSFKSSLINPSVVLPFIHEHRDIFFDTNFYLSVTTYRVDEILSKSVAVFRHRSKCGNIPSI